MVAVLLMQATATISVSPSSGEPGSGMVVTGAGFVPDDRVRVLWDGANLGGTVKVTADGTFAYSSAVPAGAAAGAHTIEARGRDTGSITASFTVLAPPTTTATTSPPTTTVATSPPTTAQTPKTTVTTASTGSTAALTVTTLVGGTEAIGDPVTTVTLSGGLQDTEPTTAAEDEAGMGVGAFLALILTIAAAIGGASLYVWKRSERAAAQELPVEEPVSNKPEPITTIVEIDAEGEEAGWERHAMVVEPAGNIEGIMSIAGVFVGFGATTEQEGIGAASLWRSREGTRWEGIATLGDGRADLGLAWRGGVLVLGSSLHDRHHSACCWWSSDGVGWDQLTETDDAILAGVTFDGAAASNEVLVVHGRGPGGAGAWISRDGRLWEPSSLRGAIDVVTRIPGGFLAFGRNPQERRPIVARSIDGVTWQQQPPDSVFVFEAVGIASIAPFADGLVAAGTDKMKGTATVWISEDGTRWHRTPFDPDPGTSIEHLMALHDRLMAVGTDFGRRRTGKPGSVAVWESRDGLLWERMNVSQLFAAGSATGVAALEHTVLIGGTLVAGHGSPWLEPTSVAWTYDLKQVSAPAEPALATR